MKDKKELMDLMALQEIELEIEDLLTDFEGEEIHIPEVRLEKALEEKLKDLQKPKKYPIAKIATGIVLVLLAGSCAVPRVQIFAKEIIESIFKDKGIENAAAAGYPAIPDVEGTIGEYKLKVFNIYIDAMRLSFEAEIIGLPDEEELSSQNVSYSLNIDDCWMLNGKKMDEVGISTYSSGHDYTSIEVQGSGVGTLLTEDEIQVPLKLELSGYSSEEGEGTLIGETTITLQIPEELRQPKKIYTLDKDVAIEGGNISFECLEVSPTMMTLSYSSHIEGGYITGLKNLNIEGEGKYHNGTPSVSCSYDEKGGVTQYIVPSIYFEKGKRFTLQAEGYEYRKEKLEELTIYQEDTLPKEIIYDGIPLTITTLNYQDGLLEVGILDSNPKEQELGEIYINGIPNQGMSIRTFNYESEDLSKPTTKEYVVKIKVPKEESYVLSLGFTRYKVEPIILPIKLK